MTPAGAPPLRDIVLLGGGHAHVQVLKRFGMAPEPGLRLTIVAREPHTPYSGMLPGLVAGHYEWDDVHIDLARLSAFAGARFIAAEASGLAPERQHVSFAGSAAATLRRALHQYRRRAGRKLRLRFRHAGQTHWPLPAGLASAGVERRHSSSGHRRRRGRAASNWPSRSAIAIPRIHCTLVESGEQPLADFSRMARRKLLARLRRRGVEVVTNGTVERCWCGLPAYRRWRGTESRSCVVDHRRGCAGRGRPAAGLAIDEDGFIAVAATLQSTSHPAIFAAGDVASMTASPRPKSGVFAVRQGPVLADNLRRFATGRRLRRFRAPAPRDGYRRIGQ